ncbi:MAG: phage holin family protein [bacterium]
MKRMIWNWVISSIALWLGASILSPDVNITTPPWYNVCWVAALLGLTNVVVSIITALIKLLTLPVNILTLGCFGFFLSLVMNGVALYFVSTSLAPKVFHISTFSMGLALAVLMSIFSGILTVILPFKGDNS